MSAPVLLIGFLAILQGLVLLFDTPAVRAELSPNQVVIVANANSRESLSVSQYYATRRGIPAQHIAKLDLPLDDTMSREDYERRLVTPLRQMLHAQGLHKSIRVIVTVYGVPLRVAAPRLMADEEGWHRDAATRLGAARVRLENLERRAGAIAVSAGSASASDAPPAESPVTYERNIAFLLRVDEAVQASIKRVRQLKPPADAQWSSRLEAIVRDHQGVAGFSQLQHELLQDGPESWGEAATQTRAQQAEGLQLLLGSLELPIRDRRTDLYQRVEQVYGAYGVFGLAAMELNQLSDEHADASVDSELSLLWWDRPLYGAAWRRANPLYHGFKKPGGGHREIPVLMVSRLDASTADLAIRLVDRAIEAERQGLTGTVYLDARGLPVKDPSDTYGRYDQSLRDLHQFVTQHTTYRSQLDNTEVRFQRPGAAPDVAFYSGWYRLRQYEDAFTFRTGAIGYHMASAEAVSLHSSGESGWCKNALDRGITATLGSVAEPYLDAFPEPLEFAGLLMTGQYSLVESYYLTSRWVSWRMLLVGDPLYNPWKSKPAAKRSALTMFPLAPIAPSDQAFADPLLARDDIKRLQSQSRIRLDAILQNQARTLGPAGH
ncbi:MAG: TIGR03790 family protein [Nitrospira sp.]|nr:TIGR03790 family protein [Nitrospira sp.]